MLKREVQLLGVDLAAPLVVLDMQRGYDLVGRPGEAASCCAVVAEQP